MKKILIFIIGISLFSCQDAIDIEQAGELTEDVAIENVTDMQNNLNFVYSAVNNSTQISLSSIWTDEVGIGFANGGQGLDGDYLFQMNAGSNFASGIWNSSYDLINFANRLIKSSESISPEEGEEEQAYLNILAQARALRAWAHFQLLTYFSEDITDDNSAGVLLVDFVPKTNDNLPRSSTGEVFDFIIKDLDFAETNLSETMTNPIYLSQDFITAFRARMALYRENYTEAQGYAQQLIDQIPLSQPSTYRDIWRDEAAGEVIFKLERTTNDGRIASLWQSVSNRIDGSSFYEVGRALFNLLDENDVRYDVLIGDESIVDPTYFASNNYLESDILLINKYPGSEGLNRLNDLKIFRVSEMYFIKAEAQINNENLSEAASTIQEIREARYTSNTPSLPSYSNSTEAWADLLEERRIELAFEGHRYIDLRRIGPKANVTVDRDPKDCDFSGICSIPNNDYRFILPIPATEIQANDELSQDDQNPGY